MSLHAESELLANIVSLASRARQSHSLAELQFLLVNETHQLTPYRQAVFWSAVDGIRAISGLVTVTGNAPFVQWLDGLLPDLVANDRPHRLSADALTPSQMDAWQEWLPGEALWLPLPRVTTGKAGLLLVRDTPAWGEDEMALLNEWAQIWQESWRARQTLSGAGLWQRLWQSDSAGGEGLSWRAVGKGLRLRRLRIVVALLVVGLIPVPLTVLGPGELVPAQPAIVRAPMDGVIEQLLVAPNQRISAGQPLLALDRTLLEGDLRVARQELATLLTDFRRGTELAIYQRDDQGELALIEGRLEEQRAQVTFLEERLARASVTAPQAGMVLFGDPGDWVGRPVITGERIMTIADPARVEIEGWFSPSDAIALPPEARVKLYLHSHPLQPVSGQLLYRSLQPEQRPDNRFAYRTRAALDPVDPIPQIGQQGTLKLVGHWTPLAGWLLRRPLAALRTTLGL
jgi:hypothetical protein